MAEIEIGRTPPGISILPFYFTGALAFVALTVFLFLSSDSLTGHYFSPHLLALVHTAALGWGSMVIFGAAYQLLPVICERDLFQPTLAFASYLFLTIGTLLLVISFWDFQVGLIMISGGACIVLAALLYLINVLGTSGAIRQYSIQHLFLSSSAFWLLFTTLIGLLLAINLAFPFFIRNHLDILKLHAHAGLAGWFLQLITGVSTKLVPMFLLSTSEKKGQLVVAFCLQNIGLMGFLADAFCSQSLARAPLYLSLVLLGTIFWLVFLFDVFKKRLRKKTDLQMQHTLVSIISLLLAFLTLGMVLNQQDNRWTLLYGMLLFMGWISSLILGMTFKTLPFIVWSNHYKLLSGKVKVPLPKDLYHERLVKYQFYLLIGSIALLTVAILIQSNMLLQVALFFWMALAFVYFYNTLQVLFHKTNILP